VLTLGLFTIGPGANFAIVGLGDVIKDGDDVGAAGAMIAGGPVLAPLAGTGAAGGGDVNIVAVAASPGGDGVGGRAGLGNGVGAAFLLD